MAFALSDRKTSTALSDVVRSSGRRRTDDRHCQAEPVGEGEHGDYPGRPTYRITRSGAVSVIFARWQFRGIFVDWAEPGQPRYLRPADRLRLSFAPHDRPAKRLQPDLVARRPLDRIPAP